jgi:hypothetical protein
MWAEIETVSIINTSRQRYSLSQNVRVFTVPVALFSQHNKSPPPSDRGKYLVLLSITVENTPIFTYYLIFKAFGSPF